MISQKLIVIISLQSLIRLKFLPKNLNDNLIGDFSISSDVGGTHFYISPVDESMNSDIDGEKDKSVATKIEKMLVGFTNTITPGHPEPLIVPAFRDYRGLDENTYVNIFDRDQFFTPEDFEITDHHFNGTFDEFGQFQGK